MVTQESIRRELEGAAAGDEIATLRTIVRALVSQIVVLLIVHEGDPAVTPSGAMAHAALAYLDRGQPFFELDPKTAPRH